VDHVVAGSAVIGIGFLMVAMGFYAAGFANGKSAGIDEANAHNDRIGEKNRNANLRQEIEDLGRKIAAAFEERRKMLL
jgi:hypothetical protein